MEHLQVVMSHSKAFPMNQLFVLRDIRHACNGLVSHACCTLNQPFIVSCLKKRVMIENGNKTIVQTRTVVIMLHQNDRLVHDDCMTIVQICSTDLLLHFI